MNYPSVAVDNASEDKDHLFFKTGVQAFTNCVEQGLFTVRLVVGM